MKSYKHVADFGDLAEFLLGVVGAAVFEFQKAGDAFGLQLSDSLIDVLGEDEVEEGLLLVVVVGRDYVLMTDSLLSIRRGFRIRSWLGEQVAPRSLRTLLLNDA